MTKISPHKNHSPLLDHNIPQVDQNRRFLHLGDCSEKLLTLNPKNNTTDPIYKLANNLFPIRLTFDIIYFWMEQTLVIIFYKIHSKFNKGVNTMRNHKALCVKKYRK